MGVKARVSGYGGIWLSPRGTFCSIGLLRTVTGLRVCPICKWTVSYMLAEDTSFLDQRQRTFLFLARSISFALARLPLPSRSHQRRGKGELLTQRGPWVGLRNKWATLSLRTPSLLQRALSKPAHIQSCLLLTRVLKSNLSKGQSGPCIFGILSTNMPGCWGKGGSHSNSLSPLTRPTASPNINRDIFVRAAFSGWIQEVVPNLTLTLF